MRMSARHGANLVGQANVAIYRETYPPFSRPLQSLLRDDFLPYEVIPVVGYEDIEAAKAELTESRDTVRSSKLLY